MELLIPIIKIIHVIVSVFLIIVILLQPGQSGDLGSVFGGGTSESVFGSAGAVPFLAKVTRLLAVVFLLSSLTLGYISVRSIGSSVIQDKAPSQSTKQENPAKTDQGNQESPEGKLQQKEQNGNSSGTPTDNSGTNSGDQ